MQKIYTKILTVDIVALELADLADNNGASWQVHELQPPIEALLGLEG